MATSLVTALGTFKYDMIPGIKTIAEIAPDVHQERGRFPLQDLDVSATKMDVAFINSKGFGGNNATALVLSSNKVESMLATRYADQFDEYLSKREATRSAAAAYAQRADSAQLDVIYRFGEALIDDADLIISSDGIRYSRLCAGDCFCEGKPLVRICSRILKRKPSQKRLRLTSWVILD